MNEYESELIKKVSRALMADHGCLHSAGPNPEQNPCRACTRRTETVFGILVEPLKALGVREAVDDPDVIREVQWRLNHVGTTEVDGTTPNSRFDNTADAALSVLRERD